MSTNTGGLAFPLASHGGTKNEGMTLRDYFAAKIAAAQSVATSADAGYMNPAYTYPDGAQTVAQKIAANAYAVADAMIAARGSAIGEQMP